MDLHFADPLDLEQMAAHAGFSKFHFARAFKDAYGETPTNYLTRRRVERAKNLLRSANLTVTEVCMLVGFSSLGSFSSRFSELVGMSPSTFQRTSVARGGPPPVPGCFLMDWGVPGRARKSAISEKPARVWPPYRDADDPPPLDMPVLPVAAHLDEGSDTMIRRMSHTSVFVLDQDSAKAFYTEKLGFEERFDITMERNSRCRRRFPVADRRSQGSTRPPDHPFLVQHGSVARGGRPAGALVAGGSMGVGVMQTDDCARTYEELLANGVTFLAEPAERPYGIEATLRDDSGNMMSLVQPFDFDAAAGT